MASDSNAMWCPSLMNSMLWKSLSFSRSSCGVGSSSVTRATAETGGEAAIVIWAAAWEVCGSREVVLVGIVDGCGGGGWDGSCGKREGCSKEMWERVQYLTMLLSEWQAAVWRSHSLVYWGRSECGSRVT